MNAELAALAKERAERAPQRPQARAPTTATTAWLPSRTSVIKVAGVAALIWLILARVYQSSCGCGPKGVENAIKSATEGLGKLGKMEFSWEGLSKGLGDVSANIKSSGKALQAECERPTVSAICTTACWLDGGPANELQRVFWKQCFKASVFGKPSSSSGGSGGSGDENSAKEEV